MNYIVEKIQKNKFRYMNSTVPVNSSAGVVSEQGNRNRDKQVYICKKNTRV